jgi:hypothetical protein
MPDKLRKGKMVQKFSVKLFCYSLLIFLVCSCTKEVILVPDNEPISNFNISRIKIENYVNRLYIDIIGREPLNEELTNEVNDLQEAGLSREARMSIIQKLMTDDTFREEEGSFKAAYTLNLYTLAKVRCLEGVADDEVQGLINIAKFGALQDSLLGNWDAYFRKQETIRKYEALLQSKQQLYEGLIQYHELYAFAINNGVYDEINMNTFNYVRAVFDDLLWRLPTEQEFQASFTMIELNQSSALFGKSGSDKQDFIDIIISTQGMLEGMIIWAYQIMLNRAPRSR